MRQLEIEFRHVIPTAGPVDSNVSCADVVRLNHCPEGRRIRYDDSDYTNRGLTPEGAE
jgi:hypothetical protein